MFNLSTHQFSKSEGEWLTVKDINDNETEGKLLLLPIYSKEYKEAKAIMSRKALEKTKKFGKKDMDVDMLLIMNELQEETGLALLVACTKEIKGFSLDGETELENTKANIESIYKEYPFIAKQADEFIGETQNFLLQPSVK